MATIKYLGDQRNHLATAIALKVRQLLPFHHQFLCLLKVRIGLEVNDMTKYKYIWLNISL